MMHELHRRISLALALSLIWPSRLNAQTLPLTGVDQAVARCQEGALLQAPISFFWPRLCRSKILWMGLMSMTVASASDPAWSMTVSRAPYDAWLAAAPHAASLAMPLGALFLAVAMAGGDSSSEDPGMERRFFLKVLASVPKVPEFPLILTNTSRAKRSSIPWVFRYVPKTQAGHSAARDSLGRLFELGMSQARSDRERTTFIIWATRMRLSDYKPATFFKMMNETPIVSLLGHAAFRTELKEALVTCIADDAYSQYVWGLTQDLERRGVKLKAGELQSFIHHLETTARKALREAAVRLLNARRMDLTIDEQVERLVAHTIESFEETAVGITRSEAAPPTMLSQDPETVRRLMSAISVLAERLAGQLSYLSPPPAGGGPNGGLLSDRLTHTAA